MMTYKKVFNLFFKIIRKTLFILLISLFVTDNVHAATFNTSTYSGSLPTLGGKKFNDINSYLTISSYSESNLSFNGVFFDIDSIFEEDDTTSTFENIVKTRFKVGYVVLDYCSSYGQLVDDVYSSYYNYFDYLSYQGKCYATSSNQGALYRVFLRLSGADYTYVSSNPSYLSYPNSVLHYHNNTEYSVYLRFLNIVLYDEADYYSLLNDIKDQDQANSIINSNNETNNKLDEAENTRKGIWETIKSLPGNIVNLLVDGLKSLFIPTETQISEVIEESKELSDNFGFIGEGVNFSVQLFTSLLNISQSTGCVDFPEFSLDFSNIEFIGYSIKFWDKKSVCLADNQWFGANSNGIVVVRFISTVILIIIFLNFCYKAFFRVLSKRSVD